MQPKPRACRSLKDLRIGDRFSREYRITQDEVQRFAELSGDYNPIHFDAEYAGATVFKHTITHGMLSAAKFSGIFGMDMPGLGALWQSQEIRFLGPIFVDRPYTAVVEVKELRDKAAVFATWVEDGRGERVIDGHGVLSPIPDKVRRAFAGDELSRMLDPQAGPTSSDR